jgi:hypothetical protein
MGGAVLPRCYPKKRGISLEACTSVVVQAALLRQAESELSQAIDDLPMTAAHNQHFGVVPRPDTRGGVLTSGNGEAHADREADLSDPEDMFVNGAGSGWRPPGGGEAAAALLGVSGSRPELFNTTLMAVRMMPCRLLVIAEAFQQRAGRTLLCQMCTTQEGDVRVCSLERTLERSPLGST